jgi:hypothetical protein
LDICPAITNKNVSLQIQKVCNMKPKKYKISERDDQVVEEPLAVYGVGNQVDVTSSVASDSVISADPDAMTVDEFIGKIKKALDRRYENV